MALKKVKGTLERVLDKNMQDLVRGIRNHKECEVCVMKCYLPVGSHPHCNFTTCKIKYRLYCTLRVKEARKLLVLNEDMCGQYPNVHDVKDPILLSSDLNFNLLNFDERSRSSLSSKMYLYYNYVGKQLRKYLRDKNKEYLAD